MQIICSNVLQAAGPCLRSLLAEMDKNRSKNGGSDAKDVEPGELKLDADQDELREKFGIVRVCPFVDSVQNVFKLQIQAKAASLPSIL